MSYTITISGSAQPTDGSTQDQADAAILAKAQAFANGLPGVSAAFIQTISGGMQSLTEQPQAAAPTTEEATPSA